MNRPIDHEARTAAVQEIDRAYALTAGAGTGKTRTLVDRVVRLLESEVAPERIAVVTFTEAATQELRARVRGALDARVESEPDRWRSVLARLERLTVVTLHAFALELLRAEALDAGFAPDFEIANELANATILEDALRALREGWDVERAVELAAHATPWRLRKAAQIALRRRDLRPAVATAPIDWAQIGANGREHARSIVAAAGECLNPDGCKLYDRLAPLLDVFADGPVQDAAFGRYLAAVSVVTPSKSAGRKGDWPGTSKDDLVAAWQSFCEWHAAIALARWAPLHREVVEGLFSELIPRVEAARAQAGQADYEDLLFLTARMLARCPDARRRLSARYDHLLVDEVQDTDPMQAEIVARLVDPEGDAERWTDLTGPTRSLFAVGDPKQSIYRFRRADVRTWRDLASWIARSGATAELSQGFRSVPDIVAFVNYVFEEMPDFAPLMPYREPAELEPVVLLDAMDEMSAVVEHLRSLADSNARVVDPATGELRPFNYGDVMILLPAWTNSSAIQDALTAANVPSIIEGGRRFFERDEVRLSVAALRAIDEPDDSESTVFALRGLFGHTHEDLARHVAAGGGWSCTIPAPAESPCQLSLRLLGALHRRRDGQSWVAILDAVLDQTQASAVWALRTNAQATLANVEKLRALLLQIESTSATPSETIDRLVRLTRTAGDEDELPVVDPETSAVRITSYFKAKGREAPVVIVVHAHRFTGGVDSAVDRERGELALKIGDLCPPDWGAHEAREKQETADERLRWVYVAMTRARDQLVVVRGPEAKKKANVLPVRLLAALGEPVEARDEITTIGEARVRIRTVDDAEPAGAVAIETFAGVDDLVDRALGEANAAVVTDDWAARRRESIRAARRGSARWVTVSDLVRPRRAKATGIGARAGQAVHRVMEALDLAAPTEDLDSALPGWLDVFAPQLGLRASEREAAHAVLRRLVTHSVIDRARAAPERWMETPFAFPKGDRVVTGTIDLCFPEDAERKRWVVVDYKSDAPPPGSPVLAAYEKQLRYYAEAILRNIVGEDVEVVDQILAGPPPELAEDPRDIALEEVASELAPMLEALLDAGAPVPAVEPSGVVSRGVVELWFEAPRVALLVNQDDATADELRSAGIVVVKVDDASPDWVDVATRGLAEALGVMLGDEEAVPSSESEEDGEEEAAE